MLDIKPNFKRHVLVVWPKMEPVILAAGSWEACQAARRLLVPDNAMDFVAVEEWVERKP